MAADSLALGYFDSLWHYGLPSTPLTNPPHILSLEKVPFTCPSNLTHCSEAIIVNGEGSLRSLFALIDQDSDGQISLLEIHSLLARLGLRSNSQAENDLLPLIQSPNQHQHTSSTHDLLSLDFPQFAELYTSLFPASQNGAAHDAPHAGDDDLDDELLDAFRIYDTNHDGFISAAELAAVLSDLKLLPAVDQHHGIEVHVGRCQAYIDSVDLDGNGMVDLEEFKAMMMTSRPSCARISVFAH